MFGIGRWFKKTPIGIKLEKAKDGLEGLFDDAGFKEVFDSVKHDLERRIDELEQTMFVAGALKWKSAALWLGTKYPEAAPYISKFHAWASAWIEMKKAAGLFK